MLGSCAIIRDVLLDSHRYPFFFVSFYVRRIVGVSADGG